MDQKTIDCKWTGRLHHRETERAPGRTHSLNEPLGMASPTATFCNHTKQDIDESIQLMYIMDVVMKIGGGGWTKMRKALHSVHSQLGEYQRAPFRKLSRPQLPCWIGPPQTLHLDILKHRSRLRNVVHSGMYCDIPCDLYPTNPLHPVAFPQIRQQPQSRKPHW